MLTNEPIPARKNVRDQLLRLKWLVEEGLALYLPNGCSDRMREQAAEMVAAHLYAHGAKVVMTVERGEEEKEA